MADFKACDIHGKEFPANLIDLNKESMTKVYVERKEMYDGKAVTLSLFVGNNADEGIDACHADMMTALIDRLTGLKTPFSWKVITWHEETVAKRDGSGTYKKNTKKVESFDEYKLRLSQEKLARMQAPATK